MGCSQVKPTNQATDIMGNAIGEIVMATIGGSDQPDGGKQQAWGECGTSSGGQRVVNKDVNGNHNNGGKTDDIQLQDVKETIADELGKSCES